MGNLRMREARKARKTCENGEGKQENSFVHETGKNHPENQTPLAPALMANSSTSVLTMIGFGGGASKCL
jgi:hypothetical protein